MDRVGGALYLVDSDNDPWAIATKWFYLKAPIL
jgi:hypothetical protein